MRPRDSFTGEVVPVSKAIPNLVRDQSNAILTASSFQEIYHILDEGETTTCVKPCPHHCWNMPGLFIRLDPNIEPTKNRAATVSSRELERLRGIQNTVRNTKRTLLR